MKPTVSILMCIKEHIMQSKYRVIFLTDQGSITEEGTNDAIYRIFTPPHIDPISTPRTYPNRGYKMECEIKIGTAPLSFYCPLSVSIDNDSGIVEISLPALDSYTDLDSADPGFFDLLDEILEDVQKYSYDYYEWSRGNEYYRDEEVTEHYTRVDLDKPITFSEYVQTKSKVKPKVNWSNY